MITAANLKFLIVLILEMARMVYTASFECSLPVSSNCECAFEPSKNITGHDLCSVLDRNIILLKRDTLNLTSVNVYIIYNEYFSVLNCKHCVKILYMDNSNISIIYPRGFESLRYLRILYLDRNSIAKLHRETFVNNTELRILDISINNISLLDTNTFIHNKKLFYLNISYNMLIINGSILNIKGLNILDIAYCNPMGDTSWYVMSEENFRGLPNLTRLVLEGNKIRSLQSNTFRNNPRLIDLNLKNNLLQTIHNELLHSSRNLRSIQLSNNHLKCDCKMQRFSKWLSDQNIQLDQVSCYMPEANWDLLKSLHCNNTAEVITEMLETIISPASTTLESVNSASTNSLKVISQVSTVTIMKTEQTETSVQNESISTASILTGITEQGTFTSLSAVIIARTIEPRIQTSNIVLITTGWYALGAICCVIATVITTLLVIKLIQCSRRKPRPNSTNAVHYFDFKIFKKSANQYDKVPESHHSKEYIGFNSLSKITGQKTNLHYSSRDVTNLPALPTRKIYDRHSTSSSSGILETDLDTLSTVIVHTEHIYEVID